MDRITHDGMGARFMKMLHIGHQVPNADEALQAQAAQEYDALIRRFDRDTGEHSDVFQQIGRSLYRIKMQMLDQYYAPITDSRYTRLSPGDYVKKIYGEQAAFIVYGINDNYPVLNNDDYYSIPQSVVDAVSGNPQAQYVPEDLPAEDCKVMFFRDPTSQQTRDSRRIDIQVARFSTPLTDGISLFVDREIMTDYVKTSPAALIPNSSLTGIDGGIISIGFILNSPTISGIIKANNTRL